MSDGRKNNGGAREGAGRKTKAEELGLAALLEKCFTEKDREACVKKLVKDAKNKDFHVRQESRKLLLAYAFGKPAQTIEMPGIEEVLTELIKPKPDDDND